MWRCYSCVLFSIIIADEERLPLFSHRLHAADVRLLLANNKELPEKEILRQTWCFDRLSSALDKRLIFSCHDNIWMRAMCNTREIIHFTYNKHLNETVCVVSINIADLFNHHTHTHTHTHTLIYIYKTYKDHAAKKDSTKTKNLTS